jgi:hypothetical protein
MPIAVRCACGRKFKVADEHAGKRGQCPACGKKLVVPMPDKAAAPVAKVKGVAGELTAAEEGFEGVADLLDEALKETPPAPALSSNLMAPAVQAPRKKKRQTASGMAAQLSEHIVSIVVIGAIVALTIGIVWGGRTMVQRFRFTQALGGGDASGALEQVAADLPYTVSYANGNSTDMENSQRRRLQMIAKVLPSLPDGIDLSPLLEMRPDTIPYSAAFDVVRSRAKLEWLLEKTCSGSEEVRRFAGEVLRPTFPFGRLDEAGFAQLIERTSASEKKDRYDKLYASLHRQYEARLVGSYQLAFDTVWQGDAAMKEAQMVVTPQPRLIVSCRDYVWTIDFYGVKWTGKLDQLPKLALASPATKTDEDLFQIPRYQTLAASQLKLTCPEEALVVTIEPLPAYAPASSGRAPVGQDTSRYGGGSLVPAGATTRYITTYNNGVKVSEEIEWTLPERAGYSQFEIRLLRAAK